MFRVHLQLVELEGGERIYDALQGLHRVDSVARNVEHHAAVLQVGPIPNFHPGDAAAACPAIGGVGKIIVEADLHQRLHATERAGLAKGGNGHERVVRNEHIRLSMLLLLQPLYARLLLHENWRHAPPGRRLLALAVGACAPLQDHDQPAGAVLADLTPQRARQPPVSISQRRAAQAHHQTRLLELEACPVHRHRLRHWDQTCNGLGPYAVVCERAKGARRGQQQQ